MTSWTQLVMVGVGFTVLCLSNGFELIGLMTRPEGDDLRLRLAARGTAVAFFTGIAAIRSIGCARNVETARRRSEKTRSGSAISARRGCREGTHTALPGAARKPNR